MQNITEKYEQALNNINGANKESGFFDLPVDKKCKDKEHNPPSYMVIPKGKGYRHVCPSCGKVTIVIPPQVSL